MFDLLASLLAWFYSIVGSYGLAILLLTLTIMVVFTPLIFRSTKSMIGMRKIQPKIKKLQKKYKDDRETLNRKTMELYQDHGVNPVGGCLPLFFQAPVFLVMFRVMRGLTRRTLDTGFTSANTTAKAALARSGGAEGIALEVSETPLNRFNPEYISPDTQLYQDLVRTNEMNFLGIDLSRTTTEMFAVSPAAALPYVLLVIAVGALSLFQHRQIQGRMQGTQMNPQMELITKLMPWFLPIFALTMPAALCIYFMGQSVVRVAQQAFITQRYYGDDDDIQDDLDDDDDDDFDDDDDDDDDGPGGILGQLMGATGGNSSSATEPTPASRHGSRSPVSKPAARPRTAAKGESSRTTAPKASRTTPRKDATKDTKDTKKAAGSNGDSSDSSDSGSLWSRARRRAEDRNGGATEPEPAPRTSKRVTPKGGSTSPATKKRK